MPRYYFDLKFDGEKSSYDKEGTALRDTEAAQLEAARSLSEFSREIETAKGLSAKSPSSFAMTLGLFSELSFILKSSGSVKTATVAGVVTSDVT
jgi:hypothetical protein